jgi:hypothetical protein
MTTDDLAVVGVRRAGQGTGLLQVGEPSSHSLSVPMP